LHGKVYTPEKKSYLSEGAFKTCKTALDESSQRVARLVLKYSKLAKRYQEYPELIDTIYQKSIKNIERSDRVLQSLSDVPGIVRRYGSVETVDKAGNSKFWIFEEFFSEGDLIMFLNKNSLSDKQKHDLAIQLLTAVASMHEKGVVHNDLKVDNILITAEEEGQLRLAICDFDACWKEGEAMHLDPDFTASYLSPEKARSYISKSHPKWRSPETWTKELMIQNDLWATGLILYVVYHQREHPLIEECRIAQHYLMNRGMDAEEAFLRLLVAKSEDPSRLECSSKIPHEWIIHRLMRPNPPSAKEALAEFRSLF
jgi:serine/threonine protein kinase